MLSLAAGALTGPDVTVLLVSLGVLLGTARVLGECARRMRQPAVIGEMLAGVLLGPTCLGHFYPDLFHDVFPEAGAARIALDAMIVLGVLLLLLVAGLEVDLSTAVRQGKAAALVSLTGMVFPFAIGFGAAWLAPGWLGMGGHGKPLPFALFMGIALSITALPVIAKILIDLNMFRSDLGMLIVSAAMVNDLVGWLGFALVLAMISGGEGGGGSVAATMVETLVFLGLMLTVGRWLIHTSLPWIQARWSWPGGVIGFILVTTLLSAAFTEWIGVHAIFGAFIADIAIGDSSHLRERTRDTIQQFITYFFAPIFFASIGLRLNFLASFDLLIVVVVLVIALASKIGGCFLGARWAGMTRREGLAVGFGMAARGAMEIILAQLARQHDLIGDSTFVAVIIMAIVTSMISGPAMEWVLRRTQRLRLSDLFSDRTYAADLKAHDVRSAIAELALLAAPATGLTAAAIEDAVWRREQLMHTGLGDGLAVPHARLEELRKPVLVLGRSLHGVDFDAPDGRPARIIAMILTPLRDATAQLEILKILAEAFARPSIRRGVLEAA
ncbi:MAG: cation:proton antiporter, partial [Planctomycetota bacterium]|nr:cation:proton antiporter [Planctomycetota bacterium]